MINPTAPQGGIASVKEITPKGNEVTYRIDSGLYSSTVSDGYGNGSLSNRTLGTNRVNSVTDRLGRVTTPTFDAKENLTQIKAPDGSITKFTYEPNFNLPTAITDALGKTSTITYDVKGNPTEIKDPLSKISKLNYDSFGRVTSITNARNETATMAYDERGNVLKVTDALNHSTNFNYDILNRMTKATNALGHVVQYQYDILDRTTQVTSAEGRVIKYAYDPNSNLLSVTDPAGNVTRYDYDPKDRMIKRTDASGKIQTYQYDGNDNLVKSTDRKGQVTTYQYDANDRLVSTTYNDGKVVTNTYDDENRLVSLNDTAPGAGQHNFTYDLLDRLTKESTPRGTVSYSYDVLGRRTSLKINNQRNLNYSYDDNDRLTAITEGTETFGFSYDQLDRRAGMTLPNGISTAYNYDAAGRLTGMKYGKGSNVLRDLVYSYDEINRRTAYAGNTAPAPRDTATDTATVNALNQYTTLNGKSIAHDDNANQTINNAVWDARDRLISLSGPNFTASITYDAMGRRTSKTVNGQTKTYLYDGSDLISETGADYTFGPGIDQPLERKSEQNEYYLSDALGSVIGLTDSNGSIKTSYNYSPFGKKQSTGAASGNPFAFTSREDDGTGYYYYRARYYSPDQKRFISADPLGFGGGDTNTQVHVGNNPVNATDPSGLITFIIPGGGNEFGSLPKNISSGAQYNVTAIPNPAGSGPGPDRNNVKFNNAKMVVNKALANGLKKGEPINIIAHSDGNQSLVGPVAEYLRKRYPNVEIAVGRLDPTFVGKPSKDICKTVDFFSNNLSFDFRDIFAYPSKGDKGDFKARPGVSHMDLLNDPGVLNDLKSTFRF